MWTNNNEFNTATFNDPGELTFFGYKHAIDIQSDYVRVGWYVENLFNFEKFEVYRDDTLIEEITDPSIRSYEDGDLDPETNYDYHVICYYDGTTKETDVLSVNTTRPGHAAYASTEVTTSTGTIEFDLEHLFSDPYVKNIYIDFEVLDSSSATINGESYSDFPAEIDDYPTVDITDGDFENPVLILEYYEAGWGIKGTNRDGEHVLLLNTAGEKEIYDIVDGNEIEERLSVGSVEANEDHFFDYEVVVSHSPDDIALDAAFSDEDEEGEPALVYPGSYDNGDYEISLDESDWSYQLTLSEPTPGEGIVVYGRINLDYGGHSFIAGNLDDNTASNVTIEPPPDVEGTITVRGSDLAELDSTISVAGSDKDEIDGQITISRSSDSELDGRVIIASDQEDEILGSIQPRFNVDEDLSATLTKRRQDKSSLSASLEVDSDLWYSHEILGKIEVDDREFDLGEYWPRQKWDIGLITIEDLDEDERNEFGAVNKVRDLHGFPFKRLTGILKLIYYFKKIALTGYGSDPNNEEYGCYLKKMIGRSYMTLDEVAEELEREIKRVKDQIIDFQNEYSHHIPKEEKLRDLTLTRIFEDNDIDFWSVNAEYKLITEAGEEYEGKLFSDESQ